MKYNDLEIRNTNLTVYRYWKEKYGLVGTKYARKVLGVGEKKFLKICRENNIEPVIKRAPYACWNAKLYNLKEMRNLAEKMQQDEKKSLT